MIEIIRNAENPSNSHSVTIMRVKNIRITAFGEDAHFKFYPSAGLDWEYKGKLIKGNVSRFPRGTTKERVEELIADGLVRVIYL